MTLVLIFKVRVVKGQGARYRPEIKSASVPKLSKRQRFIEPIKTAINFGLTFDLEFDLEDQMTGERSWFCKLPRNASLRQF